VQTVGLAGANVVEGWVARRVGRRGNDRGFVEVEGEVPLGRVVVAGCVALVGEGAVWLSGWALVVIIDGAHPRALRIALPAPARGRADGWIGAGGAVAAGRTGPVCWRICSAIAAAAREVVHGQTRV
jgi:hypothetical protein